MAMQDPYYQKKYDILAQRGRAGMGEVTFTQEDIDKEKKNGMLYGVLGTAGGFALGMIYTVMSRKKK